MRISVCPRSLTPLPLILLLSFLGFQLTPAQAAGISPITVVYSTTTAPLVLNAYAAKYGIDAEEFKATAFCESSYDAGAVGDKSSSYGVFQIHLPAHTDISKEKALDPWFAIDWAAQQFAAGKASMWTCWRKLHASSDV